MKKLVLSILATGILLSACNQAAKTATTADSSAAQPAAAGASATPAGSTVSATTSKGPVMNFDKDSFDFGKIKTGDKVSYSFKFTNTGKLPLIITNAVASCGCTTPNWPKTPINPGQSDSIKVVFNSLGKHGLQDKMVTITANTNPAQNVVHLVGEVLQKQ
ncbi:DUF1573 domain-containing protein [Mucilaginibacter sp.]